MSSSNQIYGIHPIEEALREGVNFEKIFLQKGSSHRPLTNIFKICRDRGIQVSHVPLQKLNRLTRNNHQGVVGIVSLIEYHDFREIVTRAMEEGRNPKILVLDHITDVRNFGALARTAYCFGFDCIVIPDKGAASINEDAMKTSAGALNSIPVCKSGNLITDAEELKQMGLQILCGTEKGKVPLSQIEVKDTPVALIMGSEEKGIHPAIIKGADHHFFIPMTENLDSLNVSVAGGISMYHVFSKQEKT